jgi:hypothetical protein
LHVLSKDPSFFFQRNATKVEKKKELLAVWKVRLWSRGWADDGKGRETVKVKAPRSYSPMCKVVSFPSFVDWNFLLLLKRLNNLILQTCKTQWELRTHTLH